jgi:hypothetical protein
LVFGENKIPVQEEVEIYFSSSSSLLASQTNNFTPALAAPNYAATTSALNYLSNHTRRVSPKNII